MNIAGIRRLYDYLAKVQGWAQKRNLIEVFITKIPTLDQILFVLDGLIPDINERKIV